MRCVGQAGASCPLTCALGIFMGAFHPALCLGSASARNRDAWCWVGAPLARMVFIMENCIWRSENAHFFPAARASYSVRYLSPPPIRPKSRVTPVGRSTGTLYPTGKNRVLQQKISGRGLQMSALTGFSPGRSQRTDLEVSRKLGTSCNLSEKN